MTTAAWGVFRDGVCVATFMKELDAKYDAHVRDFESGIAHTWRPLMLEPVNLLSHKAAWLAILGNTMTINAGGADAYHWRGLFEAMQAMYKELEK